MFSEDGPRQTGLRREIVRMIAPESAAVRERFDTAGYVVLEDFTSADARAGLRGRALEIVDAFDPAGASVFTTRRDAVARDSYFQESAETVRCFFEEEAFDENGALRAPKPLSINKIGHAMHDLDPVFERFSRDPRLDELVRVLGIAEPRIYQSMYIFKQPHIGGEVHWHQDATFFATTPQSVVTLWFALEDANRDNGACGCSRVAIAGRFANNSLRKMAGRACCSLTLRLGRRRATRYPLRSRPARSSR
jgi:phytanoyl-CoA hydroxylase